MYNINSTHKNIQKSISKFKIQKEFPTFFRHLRFPVLGLMVNFHNEATYNVNIN